MGDGVPEDVVSAVDAGGVAFGVVCPTDKVMVAGGEGMCGSGSGLGLPIQSTFRNRGTHSLFSKYSRTNTPMAWNRFVSGSGKWLAGQKYSVLLFHDIISAWVGSTRHFMRDVGLLLEADAECIGSAGVGLLPC